MNSNNLISMCVVSCTASTALVVLMSSSLLVSAILVQPHNYMLDDSPMTNQHDSSGSLSPYYNDAHNGAEQQADKDIVSIIGDSLARLRLARMLDQQQQQQQDNQEGGQLSQEMADLIQSEQQQAKQEGQSAEQAASLSSSVANMLMNVAQAAAAAASSPQDEQAQAQAAADLQDSSSAVHNAGGQSARGPIMELDTTQSGGQNSASMPSKSDLKQSGPIQWYNPKETIPVLKISSMATPSKYKKVYFRSEKKLVDGAFHSQSGSEQGDKKSGLVKPFASTSMAGVQRRSSRGSSASSAPPSVLQDGVIDFLKKFRDVYVQTRPAGQSGSAASGPINFSSVMSAAASSPFAAILAPGSSGSRPNFASALSAAGQMVNSAAMLSQAASSSPSSSSGSSGTGAAAGSAASGAANANKSPLTPQSYVSFWSKTFPTWVRKMLKQMRRRSLYNSSKRHQNQHQHASSTGISQKASGANVVDSPGANNSGSSSSMSNSNSNSS